MNGVNNDEEGKLVPIDENESQETENLFSSSDSGQESSFNELSHTITNIIDSLSPSRSDRFSMERKDFTDSSSSSSSLTDDEVENVNPNVESETRKDKSSSSGSAKLALPRKKLKEKQKFLAKGAASSSVTSSTPHDKHSGADKTSIKRSIPLITDKLSTGDDDHSPNKQSGATFKSSDESNRELRRKQTRSTEDTQLTNDEIYSKPPASNQPASYDVALPPKIQEEPSTQVRRGRSSGQVRTGGPSTQVRTGGPSTQVRTGDPSTQVRRGRSSTQIRMEDQPTQVRRSTRRTKGNLS